MCLSLKCLDLVNNNVPKKATGPDKIPVKVVKDQLLFEIAFPKSMKGSYITKSHLFQMNFYQISSLLTEKDTVQIMF